MTDKNEILRQIEGQLGDQGSRELAVEMFDLLECTGYITFSGDFGYAYDSPDEWNWQTMLRRADQNISPDLPEVSRD